MNLTKQLAKTSLLPYDGFISHEVKEGFKGIIEIHGKPVRVSVSKKAHQQLAQQTTPLLAEMELYFSCLIRKRVLFTQLSEQPNKSDNSSEALPGLYISFSPVTTKECRIADNPDGPLLKAMPIKEPGRFVPDWIKIHYRSGQWTGEYGFKIHT